ncbi:MAG TPA: hypothetical protein DCW47_00455 [Lachnospiraceae bacterium]|nr:hypothetical protein [Lachnospiraceae bacterium]
MVLRIRSEELNLFDGLDPFGFLERLELPDHFALGCIRSDEEKGDSVVGLLTASASPERLTIEWLCTDPEYRGTGVADELIKKMEKIARNNGIGEVAALFTGDIDLKEIERDSESYFRFLGYDKEKELYGEWEKEIGSFLNHHFFKNASPKHVTAKPLEAVGEETAGKAISHFGKVSGSIRLFDILSCPGDYDYKVSSILFENERPTGLFLVQSAGNTFYPVFLYTKDAVEALALFKCSMEGAETRRPEGNVRVISSDSRVTEFMEKLFPGERISTRLLIRDMESVNGNE